MMQVITTTFTFRNDGSEGIFFTGADMVYISGEYILVTFWLKASEIGSYRYDNKKEEIEKLRSHPLMVNVTEQETYV